MGAHQGFSRLSSGGGGAALALVQGAREALDATFVDDALVGVDDAVAVAVALEVAVVVGGGGALVPVEDGFGDDGHPVAARSATARAAMFTRWDTCTTAR